MAESNHIEEDFTPAPEMVLKDLETVKVVSHPLRLQICEYLLGAPRTVKEIAEFVGMPPTKLYYHINLMEKHGLVRVVKTRVVSGIIEKSYWVTAYSLRPEESLLSRGGAMAREGFPLMVSSVLERTAGDINRSIDAGLIDFTNTNKENRTLLMVHNMVKLPNERYQEFLQRFEELILEFNKANTGAEDGTIYGLTVAMYPTTYKGTLPEGQQR